jgi:hypothetical protein
MSIVSATLCERGNPSKPPRRGQMYQSIRLALSEAEMNLAVLLHSLSKSRFEFARVIAESSMP